DDARGLARAHFAWGLAQNLLGRCARCAEHSTLAAEYEYRAGDEGLRARALSWWVSALYHGMANAETVRAAI
ncbi:MAG: hypothetical protein JO240_13825, partial [Solirubrobacterales bacterium]|nr:hypothetical protein [Solirubrobacterales bacterium]